MGLDHLPFIGRGSDPITFTSIKSIFICFFEYIQLLRDSIYISKYKGGITLFKKFLSIILVLVAVSFIFFNSSKTAKESNALSKSVISKIVNLKPVNDIAVSVIVGEDMKIVSEYRRNDMMINKLNSFVRQSGHAAEFAFLAIMLLTFIRSFSIDLKKNIICVLFFILLLGVMDEFYQIYIEGRDSSVIDIVVDFLGGLAGIITYLILGIPNRLIYKYYKNKY
jgi:VanZ family protein